MYLPRSLKENTFNFVGIILTTTILLAVLYLFYQKRIVEDRLFGEILPGSDPFIIYSYDMIILMTLLICLIAFLWLVFLVNQKMLSNLRLLEKIAAKDELLSISAHELSAPLTNIKGTLSLLKPLVPGDYKVYAE